MRKKMNALQANRIDFVTLFFYFFLCYNKLSLLVLNSGIVNFMPPM